MAALCDTCNETATGFATQPTYPYTGTCNGGPERVYCYNGVPVVTPHKRWVTTCVVGEARLGYSGGTQAFVAGGPNVPAATQTIPITLTNTGCRPLEIVGQINSNVQFVTTSGQRIRWEYGIVNGGGGVIALDEYETSDGVSGFQGENMTFTVCLGILAAGGSLTYVPRVRYTITAGSPAALTGVVNFSNAVRIWAHEQ